MVGLNSAIREQRRDKRLNLLETPELDPNLIFSDDFDPFSSSLHEYEDLELVDDWICEPDYFEMANESTNFNSVAEGDKEKRNEMNQVCEEFSPIYFTRESESPSEVDNVGAKFGEVCLDVDRGILSEKTFFGSLIAENECPAGKTQEIASERLNNVMSCSDGFSRVSVAGPLLKPDGEYVEDAGLVQRTADATKKSAEACLEESRGNLFTMAVSEDPLANAECPTRKSEEIPVETSQNVTTSGGDGVSGISVSCPNEGYFENKSFIQRLGDTTEMNALEKNGVFLHVDRGFEHLAECPAGKSEDILMETPRNATTSGDDASGNSITCPNEGNFEDTSFVRRTGDNTVNKFTEKVKEINNAKVKRRADSDVESGEIVSEDDGEECTGMVTRREDIDIESGKMVSEDDGGDCNAMVTEREDIDVESGEMAGEDYGEDCIGMVEPDSEYCSDSSLSSTGSDDSEDDEDEEEEDEAEEGEIKPARGRGNVRTESFDYDFGSGDEEMPKGPIRSKHELEVLPPVPQVNIALKSYHRTQPAGVITSVLGTNIVVEGRECHNPLNEGTILWTTEKSLALGYIDEVFGPVKNPYYLVRFNTVNDVPDFVKEGVHVSYVPEFASYALNDPSLYKKGYDASGDNDEEIFEEAEFSDDEKEAEYRRAKSYAKRGAKSSQNVHEKNNGRAWKKPEFVDKRKNKFGRDRFLNWGAQEMKFTSKKPFGNSSHNWPPSEPMIQKKDWSRSGGTTRQCMPQPAHFRGGHQNMRNNRIQKSPQHMGHPSGRVNLNCSQDATGGIHPVQPSVVGVRPVCDGDNSSKSNPSTVSHSSPSHDPMGQTPEGQHHTRLLQDSMGQSPLGQPQFRPLCGPAPGLHPAQPYFRAPFQEAAGGINLAQLPGGPMLNGLQINANPMGFPLTPMHPALLGQPAQSGSIQLAAPVMAWNAGQSNHVGGGSQLLPSNANQGAGKPLNFNQMNTCVGIPVLQQSGLYTNMGAFSGHNVLPCPMPWGQPILQGNPSQQLGQPILQGNPSQQFQPPLPSQNTTFLFSQPNNMSGNIQRPPLRPNLSSQVAKDKKF